MSTLLCTVKLRLTTSVLGLWWPLNPEPKFQTIYFSGLVVGLYKFFWHLCQSNWRRLCFASVCPFVIKITQKVVKILMKLRVNDHHQNIFLVSNFDSILWSTYLCKALTKIVYIFNSKELWYMDHHQNNGIILEISLKALTKVHASARAQTQIVYVIHSMPTIILSFNREPLIRMQCKAHQHLKLSQK